MDLLCSPYWRVVLLFFLSKIFFFPNAHTNRLKILGAGVGWGGGLRCPWLLDVEKLAEVIYCCKVTSGCRVKMLINNHCDKCAGAFRSTADLTQILDIDGYRIRHCCHVL